MFVRARLEEGTHPNAILVPQRAVARDAKGQAGVFVVTPEQTVERRPIVTDRAVGGAWLVSAGLSVGEQVVVDGIMKVRPGATVHSVPAVSAAPALERQP